MSASSIAVRVEVPKEHTWNAESVFPGQQAWEAELGSCRTALDELAELRGRLAEGPQVLLTALELRDALKARVERVLVYAGMAHSADTADAQAGAMSSRAASLEAERGRAAAFIEPEMIAIGAEVLGQWLSEAGRLEIYRHHVDDLFRRQRHVRSAEVEEVLGMVSDPFGATSTTYHLLTDADFKFPPVIAASGDSLPLTQGTLSSLLQKPDRQIRRTAWLAFTDLHLAYRNTLSGNLSASMKQAIVMARVRGHGSTLQAALFDQAIPEAVFSNLIDRFIHHLPVWHRYWELKRQVLGLQAIEPCDIWAPLASAVPTVEYTQAVEWICDALQPLGDEYVSVVRRGCLEQRWVDIYPNQGKRQGAFSWGSPGTYPFIMMNYGNSLFSASTLAHELGHSMHSYLAWQSQPLIYSDYSLFAAEVASNFHQAMFRSHLLSREDNREFQIAVIEEAMAVFHRYLLQMPTLARLEQAAHHRLESGQAITSPDMIELCADLLSQAYGPAMQVDPQRLGITWAWFGHLYRPFYTFQYATGIAGAHAIARRVIDGLPGAAQGYLDFLKAGGSLFPLQALGLAGIDLSEPEPVDAVFAVMQEYLDRLEGLLEGQQPQG
jgi:oligoendopeptidase F